MKLIFGTFVAVACAVSLSAQAPETTRTKTKVKVDGGKDVEVIGCVQENPGGGFMLTDSTGGLAAAYHYDGFGALKSTDGDSPPDNPLLFQGGYLDSDTGRQLSWIAATSQAFTVLLCVIAKLIGPFTLIIAGVFAVIALILLIGEKPGRTTSRS